jgi:hypothetical protein
MGPTGSGRGFKDGQCRVKRQAARFRLYAYNDDGTIEEITAAEADISWTVHLVNKKAVTRNNGSAADLTIDPGARTLTGPDQRTQFDNGTITLPGASAVTVPLGEIRTDDDGHLLVLAGFGKSASPTNSTITGFLNNAGWYDDISDGPVTAHVKIDSTGDEFDAVGAWVIVGPPKFAPQIDNVIALYDRVFDMGVSQGWVNGPANPSYTNDVYPILERARTTRWVFPVYAGAHAWPDPVYAEPDRRAIFDRLADPSGGGGDMPRLNSATLTATQFEVMRKWKDGTFAQDWAGPPAPTAITPGELDRAALSACVGAAFFPGIEAGGIAATPIVDASNYHGAADPFRLDHAQVSAGDVSEFMALPWQADFYACGYQWWPVPRPNEVLPQGASTTEAWDRDVGSFLEMVNEWHTLGFIVNQGGQYVEVDRCDTTFIALLTPHLDFQDVPQGPMGMSRKTALAVTFEVRSTGGLVTLEVPAADAPAHPRLTLIASSVTVGPTVGNAIATARLWLLYETGPVTETVSDQLTVRHAASGQSWTVTISANTVARKVAAAALVLDRSGSMDEDRGDGQSKYVSLREAATVFVDLMLEGDGIGIVRYNQDAQPLQNVTALGPAGDPFDLARQNTKDVINGSGLTPSGATSIGDGIYEGRQLLNAAGAGYDVKSLVVLTDGKENNPRYIADVAAEINELTYAIGVGTPQNTSAPALQTISENNGGYLLVTGAITAANRFVLQKYFLQILAGISNADVVLDPDGTLTTEHEQSIPFQLTDADAGVDVILLAPYPKAIDFRIQTPSGFIIEPWRANAEPAMTWRLSESVSYYRLVLPTELFRARYDQAGTWRILLSIGSPRTTRPDDVDVIRERDLGAQPAGEAFENLRRMPPLREQGRGPEGVHGVPVADTHIPQGRTLPFSVLVHTYSDLSPRVAAHQSGYEPGAQVTLVATLAESGAPAREGASVWAEVTGPDAGTANLDLAETEAGHFNGTFTTSRSGVYLVRVRASGRTHEGHPFHREHTVTTQVWSGGNLAADPSSAAGGPLIQWLDEFDERICRLLNCLLGGGALTPDLEQRLRQSGLDLASLRRCLAGFCRRQPQAGNEEDAPRRSRFLAELGSLPGSHADHYAGDD